MKTSVPFLNISDKQYWLMGITWGFIFAAIFHYHAAFTENQNSIVLTFFSSAFLIKALIGMATGFVISYFGLRYLNK